MRIRGKRVFITGGSRGIGAATAGAFAAAGARVTLTYLSGRGEAERLAGELGGEAVHLDVRDDNSIRAAVRDADILVNNAGVARWKPLIEQSFEDISEQVRVNLEGLMKVTRAFLPFIEKNAGVVVNIASGAGKRPYPGLAPYCATKFGVRGFTQSLAGELRRARVYCVNPGTTATRMTGFRGVPPEKVAEVVLLAVRDEPVDSGGDIDVWDYL